MYISTFRGDVSHFSVIKALFQWQQNLYAPFVAPFADVGSFPIYSDVMEPKSILMKVFVQGNLDDLMENNKTVCLFPLFWSFSPFEGVPHCSRRGKDIFVVCSPRQSPNNGTSQGTGRISAYLCAGTGARGEGCEGRVSCGKRKILEKIKTLTIFKDNWQFSSYVCVIVEMVD